MTSPIDPSRPAGRLRRGPRAEPDRSAEAALQQGAGLPVPAGPLRTPPPAEPPAAAAPFDAQLLGQTGEKRGLRAGPALIDKAAQSYNRTEWSGSRDRRRRTGLVAKTEV
jgi:hypothetical protein